ncbi:hypothetical protein [Azospirillum sp. TSO35-2]|uniref:hypothetical protein n=1 Tax=Azospirillum sp. TSO35-2 TaxID=716796 RepID=UPI0018EEA09E|nr:hypothetical protein [Azospirillum sp. TSO35-2]
MNDASKQQKPGQQKPGQDKASRSPKPGTGQDRDKTLTEKSEEEAGGANRNTPGPIYDV